MFNVFLLLLLLLLLLFRANIENQLKLAHTFLQFYCRELPILLGRLYVLSKILVISGQKPETRDQFDWQ